MEMKCVSFEVRTQSAKYGAMISGVLNGTVSRGYDFGTWQNIISSFFFFCFLGMIWKKCFFGQLTSPFIHLQLFHFPLKTTLLSSLVLIGSVTFPVRTFLHHITYLSLSLFDPFLQSWRWRQCVPPKHSYVLKVSKVYLRFRDHKIMI
jgi:hypothetical protein